MKTTKKIEKSIDNILFGFWDEESETFVPLTSDEDKKELVEREDFRIKLLESVEMLVHDMQQEVGTDLADIWERLDRIEDALKNKQN